MKKLIFGLILFSTISTVALRKPLLVYAIKHYFQLKNVDIKLSISKFSFNEFELQNIIIDHKNEIPKINLAFSLKNKYFLKNIEIHALKLDIESITSISQKISPADSSSSDPFSFEKIQTDCQNLTQIPFALNISEIIAGDNRLQINLAAKTANNKLSVHWQDLPKTQGSLSIQCANNALTVDAPLFEIDLQKTNAFNMFIQNFSVNFSNSYLRWASDSPIDFSCPGKVSANMSMNKESYKLLIPHLILSGKSTSSDYKSVETHVEAKNIELKSVYSLKADLIKIKSKNILSESFLSEGNWQVDNLSLSHIKNKFVSGLRISSDFKITPKDFQIKTTLRDRAKQIFIDDLMLAGKIESKAYSLLLDKESTQLRFNSGILELFPFLKEYLKTLTGNVNLGGNVLFNDGAISGFLDIIANNVSSSTEFGDFEGINIRHRIDSFEKFSSPPIQKLTIKKVTMGPGIENINASYKVENRDLISVHKFSANFDKGLIYTDKFSIDLKQKQIKNFLAQVVDFDLEKVLALGLKDSVKASGKLHGHLGISYKGTKPILRGLLVSPQNGWIQYRPGDRKQATSLSLSDGPMDILNNYLYDFQYEQLSLRIETDEKFDMDMTLNTFGYNPSYLNGKPLKLNINLEQNLLAGMRSLMLTYDLPARIKEKFEKVEQ